MERARRLADSRPGSVLQTGGGVTARLRPTRSEDGVDPTDAIKEPGGIVYREPALLRTMVGFIYFYFGFLKFFPDLSPAELLATESIMRMSNYMLDASTALFCLAIMEVSIGLSLLFKFQLRWMFYVFIGHQVCTFLPLFLLPELTFKIAPFAPTLEGQYVIKNLMSLAAGLTVMLPAVRADVAARAARRARAAAPVLHLSR